MHIKPALLRFIVSLVVALTLLYSALSLADDSNIVYARRQNQANIASITVPNSADDLAILQVERFKGAHWIANERDVEVPYREAPLNEHNHIAERMRLAQRAALFEEDQSQPLGKRYPGIASWHTRMAAAHPGADLTLAVSAEVEIPDRKLKVFLSMAPDGDQSASASYTINISFITLFGFPHSSISAIGGIVLKSQESWRGVPLAGRSTKTAPNLFQVVLSPTRLDRQQNFKLLKEESWFDIPIVFGDGVRAIVTFEKGNAGENAFAEAFAAWR